MLDWQNTAGVYSADDEDVQDDDSEDLYGTSNDAAAAAAAADAEPGAAAGVRAGLDRISRPSIEPHEPTQGSPMPRSTTGSALNASKAEQKVTVEEQRKAENQRRAELLRAKLIAQRQNTPIKPTPRPEMPSSISNVSSQLTSITAGPESSQSASNGPSSDTLGLDALLAEGRAAAAARTPLPSAHNRSQVGDKPAEADTTNKIEQGEDVALVKTEGRPTQLTDDYYADLSAWLEFTGYHNSAYRSSRLRTYKERKALEEEARRINERLEKLRHEEAAEMAAMRSQTAHPADAAEGFVAPPPPHVMLPGDAKAVAADPSKLTNGVKRLRSPSPIERVSRQRNDTGVRIRGANDSPAMIRALSPHRTPPKSRGRRISNPEMHRESFGSPRRRDSRSRDRSLERRQAYYKRDSERGHPGGGERLARYSTGRGYDRYTSREREPPRTLNRSGSYNAEKPSSRQYMGSAGLELPKGGVRYFMIKSWNHENVLAAQRECLWSTQLKNEKMLTEAFRTSRHVVLLFSVNKSMAFQGYALMTSPPDPKLPKPSFSEKLNWHTSPSFTLRWLATTPVHFRMIGHLKNTLNPDERGEPRAVLVGKDGQEISSAAGMGVVWVLDEAEAGERSSA